MDTHFSDEESICPEFDRATSKFFEEDNKDRILKQYGVRHENDVNLDFRTYFNNLVKNSLTFGHNVITDTKDEFDYKEVTKFFKKMFKNDPEILSMVQRADPHLVFTDLFEVLRDIENIIIENENYEGNVKTIVTSQMEDFPSTKQLKSAIKMYFKKITFCVHQLANNISTKSKTYFEPLFVRYLKSCGVDSLDFDGNVTQVYNLREIGINIMYELNKDSSTYKVILEFARDKFDTRYKPKIISKCLSTFADKFSYDNSLVNKKENGKPLERSEIKKCNESLIPGAPFEMQIIRVENVDRIEIFGK
jgi:hypothetical protein